MRDYYNDGFNEGYGREHTSPREYPQTDGDEYSYRRGREDGERRKEAGRDIERGGDE